MAKEGVESPGTADATSPFCFLTYTLKIFSFWIPWYKVSVVLKLQGKENSVFTGSAWPRVTVFHKQGTKNAERLQLYVGRHGPTGELRECLSLHWAQWTQTAFR